MKKLSFLIASIVLSAGMQAAPQNHASNMSPIDNAINSTEESLHKLKKARGCVETTFKHGVTSRKMTESAAFGSLNNAAREAVTAYHKTSTQSNNQLVAQIRAIEKQAAMLATLIDKLATDSSAAAQAGNDHQATAKSTLDDHRKNTQAAVDLADQQ